MFLLRRPLRQEADVFDVQDVSDLRDFNALLALDGVELAIKTRKEFSVKGPLDADMNPMPDRLYVFVIYELWANSTYERTRKRQMRPDKFRPELKKKPEKAGTKRPKIIPRDAMTPEEEAMASSLVYEQTPDGPPIIPVDAKEAPASPPKVVSLDLYRGEASSKKPKTVNQILEDATEVLNGALEGVADALEKKGIKAVATRKKYTKEEVALGVLEQMAKSNPLVITEEQKARIAQRTKEIAKGLESKVRQVNEGIGRGEINKTQKRKISQEAKKRAMLEVLTPEQQKAMQDATIKAATEDAMRRSKGNPDEETED